MRTMRGRVLIAAVTAGALLLAALCGTTTTALPRRPRPPRRRRAAASSSSAGGDEQAAAFPVTIEHKYGSSTIEAQPTRVVTVGFSDQDALLALGVIPVGIRDWYGDQPNAVWPWATEALGDAKPEVLSSSELNYEQIRPSTRTSSSVSRRA